MNKMKNKKYHTVEAVLISSMKIVDIGKIDTLNTLIDDRSLY